MAKYRKGEPLSAEHSTVRDRYEEAVSTLKWRIMDYWLNVAFLEGHQWLYHNSVTNTIEEVARNDDRVRAVMNRMRSNHRTITAKLVSRPLQFNVSPNDSNDASIQGAALGEALLESVRVVHDLETLRERALIAALKGGTALRS